MEIPKKFRGLIRVERALGGGFTYGDMVTYKGIGEKGDRLDKGSMFERVLLSTTSEGLLPSSLKSQPF
jgi:hypothetical protein